MATFRKMIHERKIAANSATQRSKSARRVVEFERKAAYAVGTKERKVVITATATSRSLERASLTTESLPAEFMLLPYNVGKRVVK